MKATTVWLHYVEHKMHCSSNDDTTAVVDIDAWEEIHSHCSKVSVIIDRDD